jgi:hypothetical protein
MAEQNMAKQVIREDEFNAPFRTPSVKAPKKKAPKKKPAVTSTPETPSEAFAVHDHVLFRATVVVFELASLTQAVEHGEKEVLLVQNGLMEDYAAQSSFMLRVVSMDTKKIFLEEACTVQFGFQLLPDLLGTFVYHTFEQRHFGLKFASVLQLYEFGKNLALMRHYLNSNQMEKGGRARLITQDVTFPKKDPQNQPVAKGHQVLIRYNLFALGCGSPFDEGALEDTTNGLSLGAEIGSFDPSPFEVGSGDCPHPGIEQGVLGMKPGATRVMVIPSMLFADAEIWGPLVSAKASICAVVELLRQWGPEDEEDARVAPDDGKKYTHTLNQSLIHTAKVSKAASGLVERHVRSGGSAEVHPVDHTRSKSSSSSSSSSAAAASKPKKPKKRKDKKKQAVSSASSEQLAELFARLDLSAYVAVFVENDVSVNDVPLLTGEEVRELLPKLGPRKRLLQYISSLNSNNHTTQRQARQPSPPVQTPSASTSPVAAFSMHAHQPSEPRASPSPSPQHSSSSSPYSYSADSDTKAAAQENNTKKTHRQRRAQTSLGMALPGMGGGNGGSGRPAWARNPEAGDSTVSPSVIRRDRMASKSSERHSQASSEDEDDDADSHRANDHNSHSHSHSHSLEAAYENLRQVPAITRKALERYGLEQYDKGKQSVIDLAKTRIERLKAAARQRVEELEDANTELEARLQSYVAKVHREKKEQQSNENSAAAKKALAKSVLRSLFERISGDIQPTSVYDGKEMIDLIQSHARALAKEL